MKKNSKFSKVILGILDVILGISFICMISGYYEFSTLNKVALWIWFIVFMINLIIKLIAQIHEMILMHYIRKNFALLQLNFNLLGDLDFNSIDKQNFEKSAKAFISNTTDTLNTCNLKKYNQDFLNELLSRANALLDQLSAK